MVIPPLTDIESCVIVQQKIVAFYMLLPICFDLDSSR